MRQLAILGVAALTAVALVGVSCSSDKNNGGTTTVATGGAVSNGGAAATGGATSTSPVSHTGGINAGGSGGGGGMAATTGGAEAVIPLTDGLALDGNYLQIGTLKGVSWTTWDTKLSGATGSTITQVPGKMCVYGTAAKVLCNDGSTTDCAYSTYWGVDLGWNLNQPKDADGGVGDPQAADLSAFTSLSLDFDGATTPPLPLRVQLTVMDSTTGTEAYYCSRIATAALPQTIPLANLKTNCWPGGSPQVPFDPATMQPTNLAIQVFTDIGKEYPYNFCLKTLTFDTAAP